VLAPGRYVRLDVMDAGPGIHAEDLGRIFDPYFSTKSKAGNSGLGLATVFGIVKTLGASIACESEQDKGATFHIDFPLSKSAAETSVELIPPGPPVDKYRGLRILLVEDNPGIMELAAKNLRSAGFEVLTALSPRQAVQLWRENKDSIRLLVTDVVMPERNGRELADELQKEKPALKVLFMSGYQEGDPLPDDLQHGYIAKPFTPDALVSRVRSMLQARV